MKAMAFRMTEDEVRYSKERAYNPIEWDKTINRYIDRNPQFYKIAADSLTQYDRYFVEYTVDGIRFLNTLSYISTLSNSGFKMALILEGKLDAENMTYTHYENGMVEIIIKGFGDDGQKSLNNSDAARDYMRKTGLTFTKVSI